MKPKYVLEHKVLLSLAAVSLLTAAAMAFFNPASLAFRAFPVTEFVQSMMPLVMFALFIERVLEVFLTSWRSFRTAELNELAALGIRVLERSVDPAAGRMRCISWSWCLRTSFRVRRGG